jgi:dienelactone hydrolase/ribosomal protein S27E
MRRSSVFAVLRPVSLVLASAALFACGSSASGDPPDAPPGPIIDSAPGAPIDSAPNPVDAAPGTADAAPGAPDGNTSSADPATPGTYAVKVKDNVKIPTAKGDETGTLYQPSTDGGATAAPGPFPLVVVSTGYMIGRANYAETCKHLATWGYLVISHDYASGNHQDHAAGVSSIIDWALSAASGVAAHIDATKIATAGHSMGGKVSILSGILDARIKAVIGWDPVDALPPIADGSYSVTPEKMGMLTVPFAVLGETTDSTGGLGGACAPAADNFHQFFIGACNASAALEVTIDKGDHTQWVDSRSACGIACLVCGTGATPPMTTLTITRRVTTAWLEKYLRGATSMDPWLAAPGIGTPTSVSTVTGC